MIDPTEIQQEIDSLSLAYETGDRNEVARDVARLKASDRPLDQAVFAAWRAYLRDRGANIAKAEQAVVTAAEQAAEQAASKQTERTQWVEYRKVAFEKSPLLEIISALVYRTEDEGLIAKINNLVRETARYR